MSRDTRWKDMAGYIGPIRLPWDASETDQRRVADVKEIYLEVRINGREYHSRQRIHKLDLEEMYFDGLDFILNKMVEQLDDYIEGRRT